jgi:4,5-DOPA dioxygenase extradiol
LIEHRAGLARPSARDYLQTMKSTRKMPVLFIGHGSPMNALLDNDYTRMLAGLGASLPRPKAVLVVSAHWQTEGSFISCADRPRQVYDFYGFPDELYRLVYAPDGAGPFAHAALEGLAGADVKCRDDWGLDHAAWAVLRHMYPRADVPVFELSLDTEKTEKQHYQLGRKLAFLRDAGLLILASGNIVHNLGRLAPDMQAAPFDWAVEFDAFVAGCIERRAHDRLIAWREQGSAARQAVPTDEHYLPLLYFAALQNEDEKAASVFEGIQHGSISMRCFRIG